LKDIVQQCGWKLLPIHNARPKKGKGWGGVGVVKGVKIDREQYVGSQPIVNTFGD